MAAISLGRAAILAVDDVVPGSTYVVVNKCKDITLSRSGDAIDTTNNDDAGYTSNEAGFRDQELSFSFVSFDVDTNTTGQGFIKKQYEANSKIAVRIYPEGSGTGKPQYIGSGTITKFDDATPTKDVRGYSVTIKISGALDTTAQS